LASRSSAAATTIREIQPGDHGWVLERHAHLYDDDLAGHPSSRPSSPASSPSYLTDPDRERERGWVAELDGERAGAVYCVRKSDEVAQLRLLFVEDWARGKGIGGKLVDRCIRFARRKGYARMVLWTNSSLASAAGSTTTEGSSRLARNRTPYSPRARSARSFASIYSLGLMALHGQEHVERYRATDGEEGHDWQGTHTLLLTTTGKRSGEPRTTALIYGRRGDDYLVVCLKGRLRHPAQLVPEHRAASRVELQVKEARFKARGRDATPEEKPELWTTMTAEWPAYDEYQERTDREIPVVVLEPA